MQGFHVRCNNQEDLLKIQKFENINGFDILRHPRSLNESYDILVEAAESQSFKNYLTANGINYEVFIENFQKIIDEESVRQDFLRFAVMRSEYGFKHFPRHFEVSNFLVWHVNPHFNWHNFFSSPISILTTLLFSKKKKVRFG